MSYVLFQTLGLRILDTFPETNGGLSNVYSLGGNQTYLERDVHEGVGSTDPIPIPMYITLTL